MPLILTMKRNRFHSLMRRAALFSLALSCVVIMPCSLTSCGGGGDSETSYAVLPKQFASGSKAFYILANNLWTLHATESSDLIQSGPDNATGTVSAWGEVTTGSYDKDGAGKAIVLFHYSYNANTNTGTLSWSWDSADANNKPTPALAYITTIHNYAGGGGDEGDPQEGMEGIGEGDDPTALAEHYRMPRVEFNFNTGDCVLYCGCGSHTQNLHFEVRSN